MMALIVDDFRAILPTINKRECLRVSFHEVIIIVDFISLYCVPAIYPKPRLSDLALIMIARSVTSILYLRVSSFAIVRDNNQTYDMRNMT